MRHFAPIPGVFRNFAQRFQQLRQFHHRRTHKRTPKGAINEPAAGAWAALCGWFLAGFWRWAQDPAGGKEGVAEKRRPFVGEGVDICHTSTVHSGNIGRAQFPSCLAFCRWCLLDISSGNAGLALRAASRSQRSCDFGRV